MGATEEPKKRRKKEKKRNKEIKRLRRENRMYREGMDPRVRRSTKSWVIGHLGWIALFFFLTIAFLLYEGALNSVVGVILFSIIALIYGFAITRLWTAEELLAAMIGNAVIYWAVVQWVQPWGGLAHAPLGLVFLFESVAAALLVGFFSLLAGQALLRRVWGQSGLGWAVIVTAVGPFLTAMAIYSLLLRPLLLSLLAKWLIFGLILAALALDTTVEAWQTRRETGEAFTWPNHRAEDERRKKERRKANKKRRDETAGIEPVEPTEADEDSVVVGDAGDPEGGIV